MCLSILEKTDVMPVGKASDLTVGTWFIDSDHQIYVLVSDDRSDTLLIICVGDFYNPFIVNVPLEDFDVYQILELGSTLKITKSLEEGMSC